MVRTILEDIYGLRDPEAAYITGPVFRQES